MRMCVQSLASLTGLRIRHCSELWWRPKMWLGSRVAVAPISPLAWEPPCAIGAALKSKKKKRKKESNECWWWYREIKIHIPCWWECKMVWLCWNTVWWLPELPYDSAILLLNLYPNRSETGTPTNTCTWMSIAALFTIVKRLKHTHTHTHTHTHRLSKGGNSHISW